jgi:FliI/YscN family ATPase
MEKLTLAPYREVVEKMAPYRWTGTVTDVVGLLVESRGPAAAIGDFCEIRTGTGRIIRSQVIGFRDGRVLAMPLEETEGLQLGDTVVARSDAALLAVGRGLLGRVLDGFGVPLDAGPAIETEDLYSLYTAPPGPLEREHITHPLATGIRAIDSLLPCGRGQRVGIFGGSGVGKSTLLGSMSRHHAADVAVIALIGERNREVRAFLEHELGPEGRRRAVVVAATSEKPAPLRVRACFVALTVAEFFRDRGAHVLLVMDSITRLAMAQREIGLAAGEPPSQKGYTPSVFNLLPKVLERAGNFQRGSITGFFTVLVEGDDLTEPISDAMRAILDGHIVLSRQLASQGHYPAIDILQSVSRLTNEISTREQAEAALRMREALAAYRDAEDLIQLGAYVSGANTVLDASVRMRPELLEFLRQDHTAESPREESLARLVDLAGRLAQPPAALAPPARSKAK